MNESIIEFWHGMGTVAGRVSHDGANGNSASTLVEFDFRDSQLPYLEIDGDESGQVNKFSLALSGSFERWGMANLFRLIAEELDSPAEQLGRYIQLGYEEPLEESQESIAEKGLIGEFELNKWLSSIGISYLYINQSPDTFANLFKGKLKRPDFLVLLESIGMIAVDAKNYKPYNGEYSLAFETELQRVMTFERLFRIPVWYAYLGESNGDSNIWYWISALKALEVGQVKKNSKTGQEFLTIKLENFERIEGGEDLGKLYTHRLPSLDKLSGKI